ncbi:MAG: hypothetical protein F4Y92_08025 [Dehalococcoidia bacterium]|nr:hypothetical protein [Dehalococcoidia bacterium]
MTRRGRGRPPHPDLLTPAEQRVLDELRQDGTNAEIALRLRISPDAVKYHISNMLGKLDLPDRHALAAWHPERERRRWLGLAVPAGLASLGRPLAWTGATLLAVAVVVVALVLIGDDGDEPQSMVVPAPTTMPKATAEVGGSPATATAPCANGTVVPRPAANPDLVSDCESLLRVRDTLRGTATLNWSAGSAMTSWEGITVAGTPQRVTKLELASGSLDGQLSGLLGNLTALTQLRLNGNALTGGIPSKLQLLTALTHLYLANQGLVGCVPSSLRAIANNDIAAMGLDDCGAPADVSYEQGPLSAGTYQLRWSPGGRPVFVDIPPGLTLEIVTLYLSHSDSGVEHRSVLLKEHNGTAHLCLSLTWYGECGRWEGPAPPTRDSGLPIGTLFDLVTDSLWLGP